jgi:histidinol dehydrogenase
MLQVLRGEDAWSFVRGRGKASRNVDEVVLPILEDVRKRGDAALREYAERWDGLEGRLLRVSQQELEAAKVSEEFQEALGLAYQNVRRFAKWQLPQEWRREVCPGVVAGQIVRPLERVGAYVPGGLFPLPSTLIMTAVPARVANVGEIVVTSPRPAPATLAAARYVGVDQFFRVGGAQAIAAMAFGTETIPKVDKIVGPGNAYVAAAKRLLAAEVAIDSIAGPTEVVIVADEGNAPWIAADLLAQAEHDADASALLITTSASLAELVVEQVCRKIKTLPTKDSAQAAMANSAILLIESKQESLDLANEIAPEHLCLHDPADLEEVEHAGSVFLGPMSCEALGDYITGPNHVLPTGGFARIRGGLSSADFVKLITFQEVAAEGLRSLGPAAAILARAEGLEAHARSIEARL